MECQSVGSNGVLHLYLSLIKSLLIDQQKEKHKKYEINHIEIRERIKPIIVAIMPKDE